MSAGSLKLKEAIACKNPKHPEELACSLLNGSPLQISQVVLCRQHGHSEPNLASESQQCQTEIAKDYGAYSAEVKLCSLSDRPLKPQLLESCEYLNTSAFLFEVYFPPLECREKL